MRRPLFNAASKYMVEICKDKDLDALVHYFDFLSLSYGRELSLEIIEECSYALFNKYPDTYEWMTQQAEIVLSGEEPPVEFLVSVPDLLYLLKAECQLIEGKDFTMHSTDKDRIIVTPTTYDILQKTIRGTYDIGDDEELVINLDSIIEVAEIV
jgi:hypothetical protein